MARVAATTAARYTAASALVLLAAAAAIDMDVMQGGHGALAASESPTYVETITVTKQADDVTAVDNLVAGDIDMYYHPLLAPEIQKIRGAGHDLYESTGGITYSMFVNPTDDPTNGFNPFAYREARFALNYMIDRDGIVRDLLGSGGPMLSALPAIHPDYLLVHRDLLSLGIEYDLARAESMIAGAITAAGASKSPDGAWQYDGQPITLKFFIRTDDPVRLQIGETMAGDLEDMGFGVSRTYGDLSTAYSSVYAVDPASQDWHLYTEAWSTDGGGVGFDDTILGVFYAPWIGYTPGFVAENFWSYQHEGLDDITSEIYYGEYDSPEERASLVLQATRLGVTESVRVFIGNGYTAHPVRSDVSGVVVSPIEGITSRYTPINAQLAGGDTNLDIGVRHVAQSSWNPAGGFGDAYSDEVWRLMRDQAFVRDPNTQELFDGRNVLVSVVTEGPDGTLGIPPDAIVWSADAHDWVPTDETAAVTKVTLDLRFSNWHHGHPMDINDFLYETAFNIEHYVSHEHRDSFEYDQNVEVGAIPNLVAVRVLDSDTVEIYTDYWDPDESLLVENSGFWPTVPWEIITAMDEAVHAGEADWSSVEARHHTGNWLDMTDGADAELIRKHLAAFRDDPSHPYHVPYFLYESRTAEYTSARYDAAISWIDAMGHMVISNGPFFLSSPIVRGSGADGGVSDGPITQILLEQFDDPTYPFPRGHWASFADFERLSGEVKIGSLAPITGGAFRYGIETQSASELAVSDFNEYLDARGEKWSLRAVQYDTETHPATTLAAIQDLNRQGIGVVYGPTIDMYTDDILQYARDNSMILLSCCASTPAAAIAGDTIFRMLPDQRVHAEAIARLITDEVPADIRSVITLGVDSPWATELIGATHPWFEANEVSFTPDIITFAEPINDEKASAAVAAVAQRVEEAVALHGGDASRVAVLYVGFGDGPYIMRAASAHDILGDVRWFGADHNTASPNVADDPVSAAFAQKVMYTVVQPTALHGHLTDHIREYQESRGLEPTTYSNNAYDAIWLLGLSILNAQSSDPTVVLPYVTSTAAHGVGAVGSTTLNENGDLADGKYQSWLFADGQWVEYEPTGEGPPKRGCR